MIYSGLLSVTFRKLQPQEIIELVSRADLQAIEWGGDIHVPHGDVHKAKEIGARTRDRGIRISSYGSYYKAGLPASVQGGFEAVLETAVALGASSVRVWAGDRGSAAADEAWRRDVAADTRSIAELAAGAGVTVDFEYHGGTLTDTAESTSQLLADIRHPNVRCNWQPPVHDTVEQRMNGLNRVLPVLANLHVFQWLPGIRLPLEKGAAEWTRYIDAARKTGKDHYAMLEFVKDDSPDQFLDDARTLRMLLQ